jgi:hypothetical protein
MATSLSLARRALQQLGGRGQTTRVPDEVRAAVLLYAHEARSAGASWATVADRTGLSVTALHRWNRTTVPRSRLLPVVVSEELPPRSASGLRLITAHGEKLEGLSVDDAIRIVRALR